MHILVFHYASPNESFHFKQVTVFIYLTNISNLHEYLNGSDFFMVDKSNNILI